MAGWHNDPDLLQAHADIQAAIAQHAATQTGDNSPASQQAHQAIADRLQSVYARLGQLAAMPAPSGNPTPPGTLPAGG